LLLTGITSRHWRKLPRSTSATAQVPASRPRPPGSMRTHAAGWAGALFYLLLPSEWETEAKRLREERQEARQARDAALVAATDSRKEVGRLQEALAAKRTQEARQISSLERQVGELRGELEVAGAAARETERLWDEKLVDVRAEHKAALDRLHAEAEQRKEARRLCAEEYACKRDALQVSLCSPSGWPEKVSAPYCT
jgi:hypothetical protein